MSDDEEDIIEDEEDEEGGAASAMHDLQRKTISSGRRRQLSKEDAPETILDKAGHVTEGITKAFTGAVDVTNQGINKVVGATTGLMVSAASNAPVLNKIVKPHVHR